MDPLPSRNSRLSLRRADFATRGRARPVISCEPSRWILPRMPSPEGCRCTVRHPKGDRSIGFLPDGSGLVYLGFDQLFLRMLILKWIYPKYLKNG